MTNYVRSQFCVGSPIQQVKFYQLLQKLDYLGCKYNVSEKGVVTGYLETGDESLLVEEQELDDLACPSKLQQLAVWLATPGFVDIALGWQIQEHHFEAKLTKWTHTRDKRERLSFDVDDSVFLSQAIEFTPGSGDYVYGRFKQIAVEIIQQIQPLIGVIDEEADLLCDTLSQYGSIVSWGNFFSQSLLAGWSAGERQTLRQSVDEHISVGDLGILTFIHPLAANQAWSTRHEKISAILQRHRIGNS